LSLDPARFEKYEDYYFAIHLNPAVQLTHVLSMLSGFSLLFLSFAYRNPWFLVPYLPVFGGIPQVSHRVFDGIWSPAVKDTKGGSLFLALRLNFGCLLGLQRKRERELIKKYPFIRSLHVRN
jgi:hypothetical protein